MSLGARRQVSNRWAVVAAIGSAAALGACGGDGGPSVVRVPGDHGTIQSAVSAASPGDMVLVEPGVYPEAVTIDTDAITVRGTNRNAVVLDGGGDLLDGIAVTADGVAIENLTVRGYRQNGVIFNGGAGHAGGGGGADAGGDGEYGAETAGLVGYRVSYVTAANNGLYGIYAFGARDGTIEHSYASGSPDSGIYIGQCKPCNVVISDSVAAFNAIGYYGTNASGNVFVVDSEFRDNRLGLTPNSQDTELLAPQVETVIAGNLVVDNDNPVAPPIAQGFFGGGIAIGGGTHNTVLRNRVTGHDAFGIGVLALNDFEPIENTVEGNVVDGNGVDLFFEVASDGASARGNCFDDNRFGTASPAEIESLLGCGAPAGALTATALAPIAVPSGGRDPIPLPPDQPNRPGDPAQIPAQPATSPEFPDLATIEVPAP